MSLTIDWLFLRKMSYLMYICAMLVKFKIKTTELEYQVRPEEMANWEDVKYSVKRNDFDGVVRSFTSSFKFVGKARYFIISEFDKNYLRAKASVVVQSMNNNLEYHDLFSCDLDFSTLQYDSNTATINSIDNSLSARISANKNTTYDLLVLPMRDSTPFYFDRVVRYDTSKYTLINSGSMINVKGECKVSVGEYFIQPNTEDVKHYKDHAYYSIFLPLSTRLIDSELYKGRSTQYHINELSLERPVSDLDMWGECDNSTEVNEENTFAYSKTICKARITSKFTFRIPIEGFSQSWSDRDIQVFANGNPSINIVRAKYVGVDETEVTNIYHCEAVMRRYNSHEDKYERYDFLAEDIDISRDMFVNSEFYAEFSFDEEIDLVHGERLAMVISLPIIRSGTEQKLFPVNIFLKYSDREPDFVESKPGLSLQLSVTDEEKPLFSKDMLVSCITPLTLLDNIIRNGYGIEGVTCRIDDEGNSILKNTKIIASESMRYFGEKANIHTSYSNFCKWMSAVFGYVPVIDDEAMTLSFVHRNKLFGNNVSEIASISVDGADIKVSNAMAYSTIKVGYKKVSNDNPIYRLEFNGENIYTTRCEIIEKQLDLTSPYRCDSFGLEALSAEKIEEDNNSGDSYSDVFFVHVMNFYYGGSVVRPHRGIQISAEKYSMTLFNVAFCPQKMVLNNQNYIAACTDTLKFASSTGNVDLKLDRKPANADIELSGRLFRSVEAEFTTTALGTMDVLNGKLRFNDGGSEYTGYLMEAESSVAHPAAIKYKLILE